VQPGNSGGALVDERGNVIGIVSAKLDASAALAASGALPENVNYAQSAVEFSGIGAGRFRKTESAADGRPEV